MLFFWNMIWSLFRGPKADPNPWGAASLEWQTPDTPPKHGNWGEKLPVVHRWAYDYSVPGAETDFITQNVPHDDSARHHPTCASSPASARKAGTRPAPTAPTPPPTARRPRR